MQHVDDGLFPGNYEDYLNDDVARQREQDMVDGLPGYWSDKAFPTDGRSLYFDPTNPPKGAIPYLSLKWSRIATGEVADCLQPVLFAETPTSAEIDQGALGDNHFINSLRLLACYPQNLKQLFVSSRYAQKGIYTFKFYKAGRWRYVHIDDCIPCRQSGKVNFCRNRDRNETFAMLLEKAYAKLHGCYESLVYGSIRKTLVDLTPAAHVETIKAELVPVNDICDLLWEALEAGNREHRMMGCCRVAPDPYTESCESRKGVTLGYMYQVVDVVIATAEATETLNAVTVGMVCLRNLQVSAYGQSSAMVGRYTGRWTFGHPLWVEYPTIGFALRHQTRLIQFRRGIGKKQPELDSSDDDFPYERTASQMLNIGGNDAQPISSSSDSLSGGAVDSQILEDDEVDDLMPISALGLEAIQPRASDLMWMQIEDFAQMFNRVYVVQDLSTKNKFETKRYVSRWIPGDGIVGSGGAPFLFPSPTRETVPSTTQSSVVRSDPPGTGAESIPHLSYGEDGNDYGEEENEDEGEEGEHDTASQDQGGIAGVNAEDIHDTASIEELEALLREHEAMDIHRISSPGYSESFATGVMVQQHMDYSAVFPAGNVSGLPGSAGASNPWEGINGITRNSEAFLNNPMYPVIVNEYCSFAVTLYQADRRWSVLRLGDSPRDISSSAFVRRSDRLSACMQYPLGIGFLVIKLTGMKCRVWNYRHRKVVASTPYVEHSHVVSAYLTLRPGRYAIIPYTHTPVDRSTGYILHAQYITGQVEFEVEDLIDERPEDDSPTEDEPDTDTEEHIARKKKQPLIPVVRSKQGKQSDEDNDSSDVEEEEEIEETEEEAEKRRMAIAAAKLDERVFPPLLLAYSNSSTATTNGRMILPMKRDGIKVYSSDPDWEWTEDTVSEAFTGMYEEVGELCKLISELRKDIRSLRK